MIGPPDFAADAVPQPDTLGCVAFSRMLVLIVLPAIYARGLNRQRIEIEGRERAVHANFNIRVRAAASLIV